MGKYKHGGTNTRLYQIWSNMKARCYRENCKEYKWYGAKGIKICNEWKNDFSAFKSWALSNGYSENLTIDRITSSGDYEPSNCRWVDWKTQQNNRSSNRYYTHNGVTKTMAEWAREYGIPESNLITRLKKGWAFEEALTKPKVENLVNMEGKKYYNLLVIKRVPIPQHIKSKGAFYLCKCDCGKEKVILGRSLRTGNTKSCGCNLGREWKNNAS
jgi:hypothetical protein